MSREVVVCSYNGDPIYGKDSQAEAHKRAVVAAADALVGEWGIHGADALPIAELAVAVYSKEARLTDMTIENQLPTAQSGPSAEVPCSTHPDAPHGYDRNASHTEDRYVCDCEGWKPPAGARDADLRTRLQEQCSDWGTYWRAPDAHGVELSLAQAVELLQDALGVEVEIDKAAQPAATGMGDA